MADREGSSPHLSYDPAADAAARYPDWVICSVDLGGVIPEVLSRSRRVILLERDHPPAQRRSSLAHALAHLDLGHAETPSGWFEQREEVEAEDLAARRLIPLPALARALAWSREPDEVARELGVDDAMLTLRQSRMATDERRRLRRMLARSDRATWVNR
ncbi:ImmA/IrrE family metallo-endopeptidase [Nocardioides marmorisolisilvae]|uniref:ImmA/IrrE family metallo-endopeptidase n=1 Tax=Nocardioides marmorisolisilvae TaxID=1542737 RepID=UPI001616CB59|nr:ImmA/IrrE family metallo-endopeptidase [Nocardioides marmorisolisilvae]